MSLAFGSFHLSHVQKCHGVPNLTRRAVIIYRLVFLFFRSNPVNAYNANYWGIFSQLLNELHESNQLRDCFCGTRDALAVAAGTISRSSICPVTYLKYLNLRVSRRKALVVAQPSHVKGYWMT